MSPRGARAESPSKLPGRAASDEPPELCGLRAERHPDPNLARPLRSGVRGDGIESDAREQERDDRNDHEHRSEHSQAHSFVGCREQIVQ